MEDGAWIHVPTDPRAGSNAVVMIDETTMSIYDAYLLRADIMKNWNFFRRHQVVFDLATETYIFLTREGRVGLQGSGRTELESKNFDDVKAKFCKMFRTRTSLTWERRYERPIRPSRLSQRKSIFSFVELDYHKTTASPKELPNYAAVDAKINEEVRHLMERILFGGPLRNCNGSENPNTSRSWLAFSAPYEQISSWTIFLALKTLDCIRKHLESGSSINWKTILRVSSQYRSLIPFCAGNDRPPVISSYYALFLELKFLYCLWPRWEIAQTMTEIHCRGSLQLNAYKALAQPLYQAYSSLKHGFRRLTDASTLEFQQLKRYLEKSCHQIHHLNLELQEIYRIFLKAKLPNPYRDWVEAKRDNDPCGEMRLLLWHGTPLDSLLGILDLGLQIRRRGTTMTGTMLGDGIYLADASSKSANFCKFDWWEGEGVLLLCEADVGVSRIRTRTSIYNGHEVIKASNGRHRCIEGLGQTGPAKWKETEWGLEPWVGNGMVLMPDTTFPYDNTHSGGTLGFNEYALYDPSHVLLRYLVRVKKIKRGIF